VGRGEVGRQDGGCNQGSIGGIQGQGCAGPEGTRCSLSLPPRDRAELLEPARLSTPERFPHLRLLRGISLHKEKQISSSRASLGEQTRTDQAGKHRLENKTGAL